MAIESLGVKQALEVARRAWSAESEADTYAQHLHELSRLYKGLTIPVFFGVCASAGFIGGLYLANINIPGIENNISSALHIFRGFIPVGGGVIGGSAGAVMADELSPVLGRFHLWVENKLDKRS